MGGGLGCTGVECLQENEGAVYKSEGKTRDGVDSLALFPCKNAMANNN